MCGINGFNFADKKLLKKMNDLLAHRGPDASGEFVENGKNVSLGQRRLAIIDLSKRGSQPMTYEFENRTVTITFNGEIYNFKELKESLKKLGYKFKSSSDTEVILASYMEWGKDCVKKFNGMWAFCIFDHNKNLFFLSRDRAGQKPLYYYYDGEKFIFSSELKGILKHNIKPEIDRNSVGLYFSLGFIPAPNSIYKNIFKVEQRQNVFLDLVKKRIKKEYYYEWPNYRPLNDKNKIENQFRNLIKDSVKMRMISDVPLGSFLSGGLDSSTVVSYAKKFNSDIHTYSIGFEGKFDETPSINILKKHFNTNHHHKYFTERNFEFMLKDIFYYYDEPFSDYSMFPTEMLSKFARKTLTASLSGDGGDEIFGGYPRYKMAYQMEIMRKFPKFFRKMLMMLPFTKLREGLRLSLLPKSAFYSHSRSNYYKPDFVKKLLYEKMSESLKHTDNNLVEAVRRMDIEFYTLPENFLYKVDKSSMINSLEVRCPFLDYRIIELSMRVPSKYKTSLLRDKKIFRDIIKDFLPRRILGRKKSGFTPPIGVWIRKKKYMQEIYHAIKFLFDEGIIDEALLNFYKREIFPTNNVVSNNYKIRLFLFWRWYKHWIS